MNLGSIFLFFFFSALFYPVKNSSILHRTCCFDCWIIVLNWILTASMASEHSSLFIVPKWIWSIQLLFQSMLLPLVMRILSALCHPAWNHRCNRRAFLIIHCVSPLLPVSHATLHLAQMHANTVPAREKQVFKLYLKKKTSVTQVSCVVLHLWEGLPNPKLVVKSCLHKSEVMFFFVEQELGQTYSIIESVIQQQGKERISHWNEVEVLSQEHETKAWILIVPPLTSFPDLMPQPVFPCKMSHRGTVNTSTLCGGTC